MELFQIIKVLILTTLAFAAAMIFTPAWTHFLYKYKLVKSIRDEGSTPLFSKMHKGKAGTPTMGGVIIWLTVLVLTLVFFWISKIWPDSTAAGFNFLTRRETYLPLGALVASALVGLLDDWFNITRQGGGKGGGLTVKHRLFIYTLIAMFGAWWFYWKLEWDTIIVPFMGVINMGWWFIPFFIFVLVATAFSVNEADGLDGLAGGITLSAFASYGTIAFVQGNYNLAAFCGVIAGALLAFLWFNINPARFFMGDTGAMSLGIALGIVAILTGYPLLLPIIGFLFLLETASVIIQLTSKKFRKKKVFLSAPIHHHFEAQGWPETKIVMRFWVIAGVTAVLGFVIAISDIIYGK
ncbi:phospho-N-acetylmuramoyl-pentapeptide-transferase [Candidatus Parcubacteria bacterium]|jgi:phospho-N-acetylmuramoyl-pentapeptide-transferase|nr:phospho-N-acetylmuramoyl-pentapeptide-transferase [Candidatus Parcubacteria bacterium]MBT7228834.1 phospho-N-acetylmuramoyl-pentapeptide-transferase [Candidatus Parcubacteria bacterium]